jgi:hypothetical protein
MSYRLSSLSAFHSSFSVSLSHTKQWPRRSGCYSYARIQNHSASLVNDKRVAIEFGDLRNILSQGTQGVGQPY